MRTATWNCQTRKPFQIWTNDGAARDFLFVEPVAIRQTAWRKSSFTFEKLLLVISQPPSDKPAPSPQT